MKPEVSEGFLLIIQSRFESYLEAGEGIVQNLLSKLSGGVIIQTDLIPIQTLYKAINDSIENLILSPQAEKMAKQILFKPVRMALQNYS